MKSLSVRTNMNSSMMLGLISLTLLFCFAAAPLVAQNSGKAAGPGAQCGCPSAL
jgi:hypothetical protein